MSGYNAYGHEQIGPPFHRNIRQQACTEDHFHRPPPPLCAYPRKERKRFGQLRVSFPTEDLRSYRPSWCFPYRQPDTWPRNTTCHAQAVDYPRPQALRRGTLHPITYLDPQTNLSPHNLQPNIIQNLERTPRCKDKLAPHPPNWEPFGGASQS